MFVHSSPELFEHLYDCYFELFISSGIYFVSSFITYSSVTSLCLIKFLCVCVWKAGHISGSWGSGSLMREAAYAFKQYLPLVPGAVWSRGRYLLVLLPGPFC